MKKNPEKIDGKLKEGGKREEKSYENVYWEQP
jgi:hypothetical protein